MKRYFMRLEFLAVLGISLCVFTSLSAFGAGDKGGGGGGIFSFLFGDFFVKKERSFLEVRGGLSFHREVESYPDPMLNLELNASLSRYLNVEVGVGGYNEQVPRWVWNDFLSYGVAGVAYLVTAVWGGHDKFHDLRDPITIKTKNFAHPYYNSALSGGAFLVPFPSLRFQPQLGVQLMQTQVRNKGSALRSVDAFKVLPSFGIERRDDGFFSGMRLLMSLQDSRDYSYFEGIKVYYGVDL